LAAILGILDLKERHMAADKLISSGGPWESVVGYSRATVTGPFVHVAGTTATVDGVLQHEGDAYGQTKVAFEIIEKALAQAGHSLKDIIRIRIYLANESDMDGAGKANGEIFSEIRPSLTMLAVIRFINHKMLVEIEVDSYKQ
jgi:enamine deaminase RidA (YjgF/YER057c/UK114 family)